MPYPSQIDAPSVIAAARAMIEQDGVDKLSLNKLAAAMGVKAPSLYRYFDSKAALLRAVNEDTLARLFGHLAQSDTSDAPALEQMLRFSATYRQFALANPLAYGLLFTTTLDAVRPEDALKLGYILPYQQLIATISGEAHALAALRGWLALIHGFIMLELAGQFRRGGSLDEAYTEAIRAYLLGWRATG